MNLDIMERLLAGQEDESDIVPLFSLEEEETEMQEDLPAEVPVLPLKNTVLFPGIVVPITVGRSKSIKAIQKANNNDRLIAVFSQSDPTQEDPEAGDLYDFGTLARIVKILKMPDGTMTAILQGKQRIRLQEWTRREPYLAASVEKVVYAKPAEPREFEAIISSIQELARQIIELSPNIPNEAMVMLRNIHQPIFLMHFIASNLNAKHEIKQELLELDDLTEKGKKILYQLETELQMLRIKDQIEGKVRHDLEKQQRDYFLNQQLKTIQEELGQSPQEEEFRKLEERASKKKWSQEVREVFLKELNKLKRMNPQVAEYGVSLNYLELMLDLPWNEYTKDNFNLARVKKVLDEDHFGLEKVKDRLLQHLAVLKLKGDLKAPILCLVGPPGVGKTSLGKSIARALKRQYIRMSLGGLHDEAEIRGHRRTYIGAMPGRILQNLKRAGSSNPLFVLDEIDKLGKDFRGDPSSALLEVLDPEQNNTFHDNYLDIEYDLSKVLFIATANNLNTIQPALLDRMEIIEISGYSAEEKLDIAKRHLIPHQLKEHGLTSNDIRFSAELLKAIIADYTRESGVRELNRQIGTVMRWVAKKKAMKETFEVQVPVKLLNEILGVTRFEHDLYHEVATPGVAVGLAWTSVGGEILFVETSLSPGKGALTLTGNLGDVMKESATTALSYLKAHYDNLHLSSEIFSQKDIHVHIPEGAIPKDGPSAGITMLTALASAFTSHPVKPFLGMTGEITLRGKVLPVGGIKEKILAARRAGLKEIILSKENRKHVEEIPAAYVKDMSFHYVSNMEEVLKLALVKGKS